MTTKTSTNNVVRKEMRNKEYCQKDLKENVMKMPREKTQRENTMKHFWERRVQETI